MSVELAAGWLARARSGVVFTGAGISTESGIPDFRGPGGFWERNDASRFTIQNYVGHAEHRRAQWRRSLEGHRSAGRVRREPNAGHRAIARLEELGVVRAVITQNVDGLHHEAGSSHVLELHGTSRRIGCLDCEQSWPAGEILERVASGEEDPRCTLCGGILKRATISFGQNLPRRVLYEAFSWSTEADVYLVVGSSLVVVPAADMPVEAKRSGARLVIVNREPTPLDGIADAVIHADAGPTLAAIVDRVEAQLRA